MLKISFIFLSILSLVATGCSSSTDYDEDWYSNTFTNIDSALKYCEQTKEHKSLLFALVSKDVENSQKLGWNILGDKDILRVARRDYILITIDPARIAPSTNSTKEFQDIIKTQKESPVFVVTNQGLYPFRQFTLQTSKERIIDELSVGLSP